MLLVAFQHSNSEASSKNEELHPILAGEQAFWLTSAVLHKLYMGSLKFWSAWTSFVKWMSFTQLQKALMITQGQVPKVINGLLAIWS